MNENNELNNKLNVEPIQQETRTNSTIDNHFSDRTPIKFRWIILAVVFLLLIGFGVFIYIKLNKEVVSDPDSFTKYIVTSNPTTGNGPDVGSYLILHSKGTFELSTNLCEGYGKSTGKYRVENRSKLILSDIKRSYKGYSDNGITEIVLDVNSREEIVLNTELVCLKMGSIFTYAKE